MYHDLYDPHFANIRCSRPAFLGFLGYTVTATQDTDNLVLQALYPTLQACYDKLSAVVVIREGQGATGEMLTRSQKQVMKAMRQFVQDAHAGKLVPTYLKERDKVKELLPDGLTHLTEANTKDLPVRFAAFAQALEAHHADLGPELGLEARALLQELADAKRAKDAGVKLGKETIAALGGNWVLACKLLWKTHCKALAEFDEHPELAEAFFNYQVLPKRNSRRSETRAVKKAAPAPEAAESSPV
jgi:hypothetical protein